MDPTKIKVYSILRIRCHFWVADFQENDTPSLVPSSTNKTGFPPSRKDVVNGRHTICRAFNIRKPQVQRFLGGGFVYKQNTSKAGHWWMLPVMCTWKKINVYSSCKFQLFRHLACYVIFFWKPRQKAVIIQNRVSLQNIWPIHFPPQGPKHHWLHQTWRGQQKGWVGHLTWCLDSTGPLSQKWGKNMGDNMGLVTSSQLLWIQVAFDWSSKMPKEAKT